MHQRAKRGRAVPVLAAPPAIAETVGRAARGAGLSVPVAPGRAGRVRVCAPRGRRACSESLLCIGGWIACPVARRLAKRLGVPPGRVGRLLDRLRIKIRHCELGCF
jgi:hypothetical protein